jgi:hypothetical protein
MGDSQKGEKVRFCQAQTVTLSGGALNNLCQYFYNCLRWLEIQAKILPAERESKCHYFNRLREFSTDDIRLWKSAAGW